MGVQGGYAPLKIQLNLKPYSPSRASEVTHTSMVWAREGGERAPVALCREPTEPAGETGVGCTLGGSPFSAESGNKKKGRSIVYSPSGWYDNAPTLFSRGCAARKAAGLCPATRKLFVKSLTKNF